MTLRALAHGNPTGRPNRDLLVWALSLVGFVCLAWSGWALAGAHLADAREGARLDRALASLETGAPGAAIPSWKELEEGDLVGRIEISRLEIAVIVLHGTDAGTLRDAVGHIGGTARPGEPGNVGLAGHRDTFFRPLKDAEPGDEVTLSTPHGIFAYRVDSAFVAEATDVHVLDAPEQGEVLTLVTCYPFYWIGPAPQRFIVHARRVDAPSHGAPSARREPPATPPPPVRTDPAPEASRP